jgi:hypothetical protein
MGPEKYQHRDPTITLDLQKYLGRVLHLLDQVKFDP